ncbi:DUF1998 domain-containing protein [Myxococcota bacterium]|nr:DUF1998 domain-containing protein [Myxococcota bacterium]
MSGHPRGPRPAGGIRRSQLLTGGGPGALVDLLDDAVIVGGPDAWRYSSDGEGYVVEPRLQAKAQRMLRGMPWWPHPGVRLRLPPECDDDEPRGGAGIQVWTFPNWFLCQSQRCSSLVHRTGLDKGGHRCASSQKKTMPVVPTRFVTACPRGHVQDVDWKWFVHRGQAGDGPEQVPGTLRVYCTRLPGSGRPGDPLGAEWNTDLYIAQVGTSGDLADLVIGCRSCGRSRGMQDLAQKEILGRCPGRRPWLGFGSHEDCDQKVRLLTRTATHAYFPQVISALSIPDPSERLRAAVESVWDLVKAAEPETLAVFRTIGVIQKALANFEDHAVMAEIHRRRVGIPVQVPGVRETEWLAMMQAPYEKAGDHPRPRETWFARRLRMDLPDFLDRVVLVRHLREVRAQVGFTRIDGVQGDAEAEFGLDELRTAPLSLDADWIPTAEVLGEGIFLAFDEAKVRAWEGTETAPNPAVAARVRQFQAALKRYNEGRRVVVTFPGARFLMLHSLAHLLITAISLECGYAATAIRERIYCAPADAPVPRAGILLYTGTPGSEGTLGGLVEVGRKVLHHLRRAAEMGRLCSNDPVCAHHDPSDGQEGRHREGAACHGCLLIGEPSCERMNQDLDRRLVVPTVEGDEAAFLGDWMASWG